jgi:hypothetical protein
MSETVPPNCPDRERCELVLQDLLIVKKDDSSLDTKADALRVEVEEVHRGDIALCRFANKDGCVVNRMLAYKRFSMAPVTFQILSEPPSDDISY